MTEQEMKTVLNSKIENTKSDKNSEEISCSIKSKSKIAKVDEGKEVNTITVDELIHRSIRRKKAYELYVPSILSHIFFVKDKISDSLSEEIDDVLVNLNSKIELNTLNFFFEKDVTVKKILTIRIKPNNVFCTFRNLISNRMISGSSTKYKVKMSKKTLRYNYKIVVRSFLEETKKVLKTKFLSVCIIAPKKIRRDLLRILKKKLMFKAKSIVKPSRKNHDEKKRRKLPHFLMFNFYAKKCFNGCRARKKKRNKQRGLRIYK